MSATTIFKVPVFSLERQNAELHDEIFAALRRVIDSGKFILGQEVEVFEKEIAQLSGVSYGIGVGNCSDALHLAQLALGIGPGDEVITSPFTFFASAGGTARLGARPVFVDIDPATFNLDPTQVEAAITPCTRAIIPVHLYGMPADLSAVRAIADRHGLALIQDAAQALGARIRMPAGRGAETGADPMAETPADAALRPLAMFGDMTCYSFFPTKNLGAFGDGGMIVTASEGLAQKLRMLRAHGAQPKYYHHLLGYNSRLDALQAAVLRAKLPHLTDWIKRRQAIADRYRTLLRDSRPVRLGLVELPSEPVGAEHVYHQFTIRVRRPYRDSLRDDLARQGVQTAVYYPLPLHRQEVFRSLGYKVGDFPEAERAAEEVLSLPMFPELTDDEVEYVARAISSFEPPARLTAQGAR